MNYPKEIQERIIHYDNSILHALKLMDKINKKLLLVFKDDKFTGVLSIGDIQKSIINNIPFETPIHQILRKDFVFSRTGDVKGEVLEQMQHHRIECMPIVNENEDLVAAYFWDDVFDKKDRSRKISIDIPVVIMAGGQGNRLKPLTSILPKPLVPLGEKTIVEHIIENFFEVGCRQFYLSINYKAELIKYYFSSLNDNRYSLEYLEEPTPLGTAGSLNLLKGKITSTFLVSNCDILVDQDITDIYDYHKNNANEITVVAALKHYPIPYGILETQEEGLLDSIIEKPELTFKINTGLYILEPHLINEIPENTFYHITSLIAKLRSENRKIGVFPVSEKSWRDIGEWSEYLKQIDK